MKNFPDTDSRTHVLSHIFHCPFERLNNGLSDQWLWIMVFNTLYLMVPLFKGHLSLTRHSVTTESVDSRGTQMQTWCLCINETPYIWICQSRPYGPRRWFLGNPSSIWLCQCQSWRWLSWGNPPSPSQEGNLLVILIKITAPWGLTPGSGLRIADRIWLMLVKCNLLPDILHELPQFLVCEVSKLCLEALWCTPTPVRVTK